MVLGSARRRVLAPLATPHVRGTVVDWAAILTGGHRVNLPTYAFQHQRYWPHPTPVPDSASRDGAALAAEARFWAAVEGRDVPGLAAALEVDDQHLAAVLPALASWRRRERGRSGTTGWRYRVAWVPVREPERAVLTGRWLVGVPAGRAGQDAAAGCVRALAARGADVVMIETAADADRAELADRIGGALAEVDNLRAAGVSGGGAEIGRAHV